MEFAVNYSPHADRLVEREAIEVDLFKCPEFPHLIADVRTRRRYYVHFRYRLGRRPFGEVDWDEADEMLETTATRYVNAHLAPSVADFPGATVDSRDEGFRGQVVAAMKADARELVARYGRERVVLENVMWDPDPPWQIPAAALTPEAIREVVEDADCAFLLDLSHASISARHFGRDVDEYISALPVERMKELHISGTALAEDGLWKDHRPLSERDWRLLEWAMARIRSGHWPRPWLATFEYGGVGPGYEERTDEAVLAAQVPRLRECVRTAT